MRSSSSRSSRPAGRPSSAARSAATSTSSPGAAPTRCTGRVYDFVRDDALQREQRAVGHDAADGPVAVRRQPRRTDRARTGRSTSPTSNSARLDQTGLTTIAPANVAVVNARLAAAGYQAPPVATGHLPESRWTRPTCSPRSITRSSGRDQFGVRYSLYDVDAEQLARRGRAERAERVVGARQPRSDRRAQQHARRSRRAPCSRRARRSRTAISRRRRPTRSGPAVAIAGVAAFGTASTSPTGRVEHDVQVVNNLSHQAGAHALQGRRRLSVQRRPRSRSRARCAAATRSRRSRTSSPASTTTPASRRPSATPRSSQTNPNVGIYAQDEWKVSPHVTLNLGLRYDLQFLETIDTDTNNVSPRAGRRRGRRSTSRPHGRARQRGPVLRSRAAARAGQRAAVGRQHDRPASLRQIGVSLSPAQAGAPVVSEHPERRRAVGDAANLTTMDRDLQNAYSRQASVEVEQQIGERATVSVGYQYLRGRQPADVGQPERADVRRRRAPTTAAGPNPAYANNSQYSSVGDSDYHGLHVSFVQRPARWGQLPRVATRCRSR